MELWTEVVVQDRPTGGSCSNSGQVLMVQSRWMLFPQIRYSALGKCFHTETLKKNRHECLGCVSAHTSVCLDLEEHPLKRNGQRGLGVLAAICKQRHPCKLPWGHRLIDWLCTPQKWTFYIWLMVSARAFVSLMK